MESMQIMPAIQDVEAYQRVIAQERATVLLFSADWCSDCRYLDTYIEEIVTSYSAQFDFYSVDRDEQIDLCQSLDVLGIPSFVVYQSGKEIARFVNGKRKFKPEVVEFLDLALQQLEVRN